MNRRHLLALLSIYSSLIITVHAELLVSYPVDTQNGTTVENEGTLPGDSTATLIIRSENPITVDTEPYMRLKVIIR